MPSNLAEAKAALHEEEVEYFHDNLIWRLSHGYSRSEACLGASISRQTFYNWMRTKPDFRAEVEAAEEDSASVILSTLYRCAAKAEKDPRYLKAIIYYIDRSDRREREREDRARKEREREVREREVQQRRLPEAAAPAPTRNPKRALATRAGKPGIRNTIRRPTRLPKALRLMVDDFTRTNPHDGPASHNGPASHDGAPALHVPPPHCRPAVVPD